MLLLPANQVFTERNTAFVLPRVFQIGTYEDEYEKLVVKYELGLLEVSNNDLKGAFEKLNSMYEEMHAHAEYVGLDIDGVRIWLHFFWNKDGTIAYLGYHLRPNSKNIDLKQFEVFLLSFIQVYRFPLLHEKPYSLYTSTSFPPYYKKLPASRKQPSAPTTKN